MLVPDLIGSSRPPPRPAGPKRLTWLAWTLLGASAWALSHPGASGAGDTRVEELRLETSDGIRIAAWFYPVPEGSKPNATAILVHDLAGSHKTVERLAMALGRAGIAVVAPDLRGHGGSGLRPEDGAGSAKGDAADPRLLRKQDLEAIAASSGGSIREQCSLRGEIEAVRHWIKQRPAAEGLDIDTLCVIGSGAGATLAANWTAADWNWQPTTSGPQGQQVRALVLVSPSWSLKGVSLSLPLQSPGIQHEIPILVLAGKGDRDACRLFDQLKKWRPNAWFQQRLNQTDKARDLEDPAAGTLFLIQVDASLGADKLVDDPALGLADQIRTFVGLALARRRE